jgi:hypothetical protein
MWSQEEDFWNWRPYEDDMSTVKSTYKMLERLMVWEDTHNGIEKQLSGHLGKILAPSKVVAFSWKLLLDWIPTRINLSKCSVLAPEVSICCVLCDGVEESSVHISLQCEVVCNIWSK